MEDTNIGWGALGRVPAVCVVALAALLLVGAVGTSDANAEPDRERELAASPSRLLGEANQSPRLTSPQPPTSVFGSVGIAFGPIPAAEKWKRVLSEDGDDLIRLGCRGHPAACDNPLLEGLHKLHAMAPDLSFSQTIRAANLVVNHTLSEDTDRALYGEIDHWAKLSESLGSQAGDCEDFAIAKFWALRYLGITMNRMSLVVVIDAHKGLYHAVLAVESRGSWFILDNTTDDVLTDQEITNYMPLYSVASSSSWIHGFREPQPAIAAAGLNERYPGELAGARVHILEEPAN